MTVDTKKTEPPSHLHARAFLNANGIGVGEICWVLPDAIWYRTLNGNKKRTAWMRLRAGDEGVQEIALEDGFPTWPGHNLMWRRAVKVA